MGPITAKVITSCISDICTCMTIIMFMRYFFKKE